MRTVLSDEPLARALPSAEKLTEWTAEAWPSRVRRSFPEAGSQMRTVLSNEPLARALLSAEKLTLITEWT